MLNLHFQSFCPQLVCIAFYKDIEGLHCLSFGEIERLPEHFLVERVAHLQKEKDNPSSRLEDSTGLFQIPIALLLQKMAQDQEETNVVCRFGWCGNVDVVDDLELPIRSTTDFSA